MPNPKFVRRKTGNCATREELIIKAKELHDKGLTNKAIGVELDISYTTISRVLNGDKDTYWKPKSPDPQDHINVALRHKLNALWRIQPEPEIDHEL